MRREAVWLRQFAAANDVCGPHDVDALATRPCARCVRIWPTRSDTLYFRGLTPVPLTRLAFVERARPKKFGIDNDPSAAASHCPIDRPALLPPPKKAMPAAGKLKVYTCAGCHGIPGWKNPYPNYHVPRIGGQNYDYLVAALTEYKKGERAHPTMRAQGESLSEQDITRHRHVSFEPRPP